MNQVIAAQPGTYVVEPGTGKRHPVIAWAIPDEPPSVPIPIGIPRALPTDWPVIFEKLDGDD